MTLSDRPTVSRPAPACVELFPRFLPPTVPSHCAGPAGAVRHHSQITYAIVPGYRPLLMDLWVPESSGPVPLVLWIHGGAWLMGDRRQLPHTMRPGQVFDALTAAGLAVASIDYRHSREAVFPAQLHDAWAALRYVHAHRDVLGLDTSRVGLWGESAGAHLASLVALTTEHPELHGDLGVRGSSGTVRAVVDWYGVGDIDSLPQVVPPPQLASMPEIAVDPLELLLNGTDAAVRQAASPLRHVHPCAPPFLIVHGTEDRVIPPRQSEVLCNALTKVGATADFVLVPGAGHAFEGYDDIEALVAQAAAYLLRHLGTARAGR